MNQACAKTISEDKALMQAKDFLHQYYSDTINHEKPKKCVISSMLDMKLLKKYATVIKKIKNHVKC